MKLYDEILNSLIELDGKVITISQYFSDNYFYFIIWQMFLRDVPEEQYPMLDSVYNKLLTNEYVSAWYPLDSQDFYDMNILVNALVSYHSSGLYRSKEQKASEYTTNSVYVSLAQ